MIESNGNPTKTTWGSIERQIELYKADLQKDFRLHLLEIENRTFKLFAEAPDFGFHALALSLELLILHLAAA